ncbi:hypothetical protein GCM10022247_56820 [Allokutzneria multivorans]|uniref:Uncharacterized protein n=1 Tax=Allokutzneria multivorans TaxID=1142134 RepID=A0ABP7TEB3_9PSEU
MTRARDEAAREAWRIARGLRGRWEFAVVENGDVLVVVAPGAKPVKLTSAIVAAGAVEERFAGTAMALPVSVARGAAALLAGWAQLEGAGLEVARQPW